MRRRPQPPPAPAAAKPDFRCDPFAELTPAALGLNREPEPPPAKAPPPKPAESATPESRLSREDRELLEAFADAGSLTFRDAPAPRSRARIRLIRHGRGGRPCTVVRGLDEMDLTAAMALAAELREALHTAVRVVEGTLEVDGDHRAALDEWFSRGPG